jgi:outer membrane immunogenic protein
MGRVLKEFFMRLVALSIAAALVSASPAVANEARVEARGGVLWDGTDSEDVWGIAAGYDWDLGSSTFAGLEVSGDKIGASGTKVSFGATGRLGTKVGTATKLYVDGGYTSEPCDLCDDAVHLGAGVEQGLGGNFYGKLGYRHFFVGNGNTDYNSVVAGVGLRF